MIRERETEAARVMVWVVAVEEETRSERFALPGI
jgi:hypothetical protein